MESWKQPEGKSEIYTSKNAYNLLIQFTAIHIFQNHVYLAFACDHLLIHYKSSKIVNTVYSLARGREENIIRIIE